MIQALPTPCWRLVNAVGIAHDSGDGTAHYDSESEARAHAAELADYYSGLTPTQYAEPCATVTCNGCGEGPDDDTWGTVHFESEADARRDVSAYEFKTTAGSADAWCEDCELAKVAAR